MDTLLQRLKTWFADYVRRFDSSDPDVQKNMDLKEFHTRRVCENILDIGKSLNLSQQDLMVSEVSALLHDIGRFEQYRRYRTFVDKRSEDHAALGVKIIKDNHILDGFSPVLAGIILRAVASHNRLAVPAHGDTQFLMILKMLRDADKLDIWRVMTEYYRRSSNNRNHSVELDLPDNDEISDPICEALMHGEPTQTAALKTLNDFKLLQIGWIYDVNFPRTFQIVLEKRYIETIRNALPRESNRVENIYRRVRTYLEVGCAQKG